MTRAVAVVLSPRERLALLEALRWEIDFRHGDPQRDVATRAALERVLAKTERAREELV